jgi:Raf kinase inhibitor-like YbhB/YbcL family protein
MKTWLVRPILLVTMTVALIALASAGHVRSLRASVTATSAPTLHLLASPTGTQDPQQPFRVTSKTFANNGFIPASMVFSGTLGSVCTGGNRSPQLSWTQASGDVESYAVAMYDITANFTHWGIYNIPPVITELPENAGTASSPFTQITNDAGNVGYSGPCPPPDIVPGGIHTYVVTVYALDSPITVQNLPPDFPSNGSALFHAIIPHLLESTSTTGFFKCTSSSACS